MKKLKAGIELCESPMELLLVDGFKQHCRFEYRKVGDERHEIGRFPGWWIVLLAQISYDGGRLDFSLAACFPGHDEDPKWWIAIEVDGHEFHERTKEQASRDRRKDRFLQAASTPILRFTGQEVWRDAEGCAAEALALAMRYQQPVLDEAFALHIQRVAAEGRL